MRMRVGSTGTTNKLATMLPDKTVFHQVYSGPGCENCWSWNVIFDSFDYNIKSKDLEQICKFTLNIKIHNKAKYQNMRFYSECTLFKISSDSGVVIQITRILDKNDTNRAVGNM